MPEGATTPSADGRRDDVPRPSSSRRTGAIVLVVVLLMATAFVAVLGHRADEDRDRIRRDNATAQSTAVVRVATARLQDTVRGLAGLYRASERVTPREFLAFADPALESGAVSALSVIEHVRHAERETFEAQLGRDIWNVSSGPDVPADEARQYAVVMALAIDAVALPRAKEIGGWVSRVAARTIAARA